MARCAKQTQFPAFQARKRDSKAKAKPIKANFRAWMDAASGGCGLLDGAAAACILAGRF